MSEPLILGFDTSAAHVAAALLSGDQLIAAQGTEMSRGQAENLMPLIENILTNAGHTWRDLTAIGVGIGPGNFTGIRISVSAARGLGLSLGVPIVGVSTFDAISHGRDGAHLACVPAPRDQAYICDAKPQLVPLAEAQEMGLPLVLPPAPDALAIAIARVALARHNQPQTPPAPLYIRAADAAPPRDLPPVILDDA